jgi:hypothetical protein
MDDHVRARLDAKIQEMATNALRTICLAYRPTPDERDWTDEASPGLICIGLVGIQVRRGLAALTPLLARRLNGFIRAVCSSTFLLALCLFRVMHTLSCHPHVALASGPAPP